MSSRWERFKDLAFEALRLDGEARSNFLAAACADDAALRAEVEALLAGESRIRGDFLESPPAGMDDARLRREFGVHVQTPGELIANRYRLVRELGAGGMGEVWLAEQIAPVERTVALKLLKGGAFNDAFVRRFAAERQSLAMMDHPSIAKVFDAGATGQGQPYFIMEYVPGLAITEYCDRGRVGIERRLQLLIQACEGVQHAHQKAVIHRDLKPANILVVEVDGRPVPKIIDFGLAKPMVPSYQDAVHLTQHSQFFGTPGYISPEQLDPAIQDIDTRADVYSLGVILHVLVTGMLPFESTPRERLPLDEMLRRAREEDPSPPSERLASDRNIATQAAAARGTEPHTLIRELRGDLDWIVMKALERDRERRYATASELAADLRRYLGHEPVLARPASAIYQIRKFVRRHRLTTAGVLLASVLAILAFVSAMVAVKQRRQAEYNAQRALQAQSRLLTQAAAQRLKDSNLAGAQKIILQVLTNPAFAQTRSAMAVSVFQQVRALDPQLAVLSGHRGRVHFVQYSPDGSRIVTASEDTTARIWDAATGVERAVLSGHGGQVYSAAYSPDGRRIVTASSDKTVRIWDAVTARPLAVMSGPGLRPIAATFSPDGLRVVVASLDNTARVFEVSTSTQVLVLTGHEDSLQWAAYSPDGSRILTASRDKTARIWSASTGVLESVLKGHAGIVLRAGYSSDGSRIVTASADKTARVWDPHTSTVLTVLSGHTDRVYCANFSRDGTQIVTASDDGTARVWDTATGASQSVLSGHGDFVRFADFSPDGARVVTASNDKTARVWIVNRQAQILSLRGHQDGVAFAAYSRGGDRIVTASLDRTARTWDAATGTPIATLTGFGDYVITAMYSADGRRIVTGGSTDGNARISEVDTGTQVSLLRGHTGIVESAVYSPDGNRIATASLDKTARVWDARTGALLAVLAGHSGPVLSVAWAPDGRRLATGSFDKTARIWDAMTGAQLDVINGHSQLVSGVAYSPDGRRLVTASFDKTARIWDARSGEPMLVLSGHEAPVQSALFSPDGARVVTASLDKTARIWNANTGVQLAVLAGHQDALQMASYAPDGQHILTASLDRTARVWSARVPADFDAQIVWESVAQTDPLTEPDVTELGIPADVRVRVFPGQASACDKSAGAVYDPDRRAPGLLTDGIVGEVAVAACFAEVNLPGHSARAEYQLGRAFTAMGDYAKARRQLELALSHGYLPARIDLGNVLEIPSVSGFDVGLARSLYETAWQNGMVVAAYWLGHSYELDLPGSPRNETLAWQWYQKGAEAHEPNALARFAARDERDALELRDPSRRDARLLRAFSFYASAALHAYQENWPDDAWRHWRYRRASLARVLATQDMMQAVAGELDHSPGPLTASLTSTRP